MVERTERDRAQKRLNRRMRLLAQAARALQITRTAAGKVTVKGVRTLMPVLELYSGVRAADFEEESAGGEEVEEPAAPLLGLRRGESAVVRAAGTKAMLEMMEIASVTHRVHEDAPKYVPFSENNVARSPHLVHFLALAAAINAYFRSDDDDDQPPDEPEVIVDPQQTVAYVAVAPGEYAVLSHPQPPGEIRRLAMRQRSHNQPQLAMLASSSDPTSIVPAPTTGQPMAMRSATRMMHGASAGAMPATVYGHHQGCGCGCGGKGYHASPCCCGCGQGAARSFPPARYTDDGKCESVSNISCETRWRVRECFKVALCDMLRCVHDEWCDDGELADEPDLIRCVEGFVCSLLECLPEAICPPPEKDAPCCVLDDKSHNHCNYAVGE